MEQWEYFSTFLTANAKKKETKQYIKDTFNKKPRPYSPESMIPELNKLGTEGWELVRMEPVAKLGKNEDIQFDPYQWSSTYFCVFKRRKTGSSMPVHVQPQNTTT